MTNTHFIRYAQWKQTTYFLIASLLTALTITHAFYYYKLYTIQPKVKAACAQEPQNTNNSAQLLSVIQKIDKQELYSIFNALVEIMPPSVKVEKLEYTQTGSTVTCRAQNNNAMVAMLEAVSKNPVLKKFALKNSAQEKDSILFVLA
jgi:Tfp pilus assembly protein PilN